MKHLVFILFIGLIVGLSSCQSEIEQADSLRLQNKFDEAAKLYQKLSDEGNAYAMWRLSIAYSNVQPSAVAYCNLSVKFLPLF